MKRNWKNFSGGFLTLEITIALALMILSISAVILVLFGSQDALVSGGTNAEAFEIGEEAIEAARALARKDFGGVNPIATGTDGIYRTSLSVEPFFSEYFAKKVTARVAWTDERHISHEVSLASVVTDFMNVNGGDTCHSALSGDWTNPRVANAVTDFAQLAGRGGKTFSITDLDAYKGKLYVTAGRTSLSTDPTFFIFNIFDPENPVLLPGGSVDNATTTVNGLSAVAVSGKYAYVANGHTANFGTCKNINGQNGACAQMQIIDTASTPPTISYSFKVPGVTSNGGGTGKSIFYKDGYVYLGLTNTASGPEFIIVDVHNFPFTNPAVLGSYPVGATINAIFVKNNYAYLATASPSASPGALIILDVSDPFQPILVSTPVPGGFGKGKSFALVGDMFYFGRTFDPNKAEFLVFNNPNPTNTPPSLATTTELGESLNGIIVRDYLHFLLTKTEFQIWNATSTAHRMLLIPGVGSTDYQPFFDCEGNTFYVGGNNASDQGSLSVTVSGP